MGRPAKGSMPRVSAGASESNEGAPDKRIPVTVITGFLGSGKTTLVNRILTGDHGLKIAVIENEFGEVGIDDALVIHGDEDVVEMNNGCICCTVRGDLIRILAKLAKRKNLDAILIETTGLADPAPVAQTFFVDDEVQQSYRLDSIVTVVDAKHVVQHLDDVKPEGVENEAVEQIAFADRILLNKVDLLGGETEKQEVIKRIKAINAFAPMLESVRSEVDLKWLMGIGAFDLSRIMKEEPDFLTSEGADHQHDSSVTSVGIELEGALDIRALNSWLNTLLKEKGVDLFRSKGVLSVEGTDEKFVFQGVHMLMAMGSSAQEGYGRDWQPGEKRVNRLVFIGRNLNRKELTDSFRACLATM